MTPVTNKNGNRWYADYGVIEKKDETLNKHNIKGELCGKGVKTIGAIKSKLFGRSLRSRFEALLCFLEHLQPG